MLIINDLSLRIAGRLLLDHASLTLPTGTKAGLVGRNGTGKTTLFKAITGDLASETGSISIPKNTRIGQVAQEAPGTEDSLLEIVLAADKERAALLEEEKTATDPNRIAEIHIRLADIDAHTAESRAATILAWPAWALWVWPTAEQWFWLVLLSLFGTAGQWLITKAYQVGEASALAPLDFSRLILAGFTGFVFFAEVPTATTLIGAAIVIGATLYTMRRNARGRPGSNLSSPP